MSFEDRLRRVRETLADLRTSDAAFFEARRRERTILAELALDPALFELKARELAILVQVGSDDEELKRSLASSILRSLERPQ